MFLSSAIITVHLENLRHNLKTLLARHPSLMPVIKADAYGHGVVAVARVLAEEGIQHMAVGSVGEGALLRQEGHTAFLLALMGLARDEDTALAASYDITPLVHSRESLERILAQSHLTGRAKPLTVAIKFDTGMSRLGFLVREGHFDTGVESIAAACALPGLEAEGIFTHFAVSDEDDRDSEAYTRAQFDVFTRVLDALAAGGRTFAIRHCANSGALARYPEMYLDMVRPGIALYGVGADAQRLDLRPVMSLKSSVSTIKTFDPGTDVSYGRTFRTQGRTRIGVLPIGYADGFFRGLSNRMSVVTAQGPAPQRGRSCMDMSMIDLTDLPDVKVGDEVEIFGRRQRVDDLAAILNTIPYELTCAVSKRVPRVYIEGGKIVERSLRLL